MKQHHGLALVPRPSEDPRDPLRWPRWLKIVALGATAFTNFTSNFAGSGLSVATVLLGKEFDKTDGQINNLLTFNFLFLGVGNLFWVPLSLKIGKRATLILAYTMLFGVLIWTAKAETYSSLLAARSLSGFASAAGESIVPSIVTDIFFLHERASAMSAYTILVSSATAFGPLLASFIVEYSPGTWRDYVWVCVGLTGFNVLALFILYPESNYKRPAYITTTTMMSDESGTNLHEGNKPVSLRTEDFNEDSDHVKAVQKPWKDIWCSFALIDHSTSFLRTTCRPLIMLGCPDVLLAVYVYGTALAAQVILIFAFPSFLMAPPYLFSAVGVGLMQVPAIIGFILATFLGGYLADTITARVIRKQNGHVAPAQRLVGLLPAFWVSPVGCIITAFACSQKLHWIAIAFGFGMVSFGTVFAPNIVITFVVESHPDFAAEALVVINVFKNLVAFVFLYTAVDWVQGSGWLEVYMIMFMLLTLSMLFSGLAYMCRRRLAAIDAKITRLL